MFDPRAPTRARRRSELPPPFASILCGVEPNEASAPAIDQALAVAGGDATLTFATAWHGHGSFQHARVAGERARRLAEQAAERARASGVEARCRHFEAVPLGEALASASAMHDLIVVAAHRHVRATGVALGEAATQLVHRAPVPVLVARERALDSGIVVASRGVAADRRALTAATRLAARLGAELTVVHVPGRHDDRRRAELQAELADARALLGRPIDFLDFEGPAARTIVSVAEGDGAGLVVLGSDGRHGLPAVRSVSERVAHTAPCSVLVMRPGEERR